MKFQVYFEVRNKYDGVLLFAAVNTPFPVRKPTTERLPLLYHTQGRCGRLTMLQKVSLPLCKTLPLCHPNLILCCLQTAVPPHPNLVFCFLCVSLFRCLFSSAGGT